MIEYPAWQAFQSLVRESFYNRVTAGAVACAAKAALAEQVDRAEQAEATIEMQRDELGKVDVQLGDARLTIARLKKS